MSRPLHKCFVSPEVFIKAWQTSPSAIDAAKECRMTIGCAWARVTNYRRKGVQLKRHHNARQPYDWTALASLARSLAR